MRYQKRNNMVTIDYIIKSALQCDTTIAQAFLRALGIPARSRVVLCENTETNEEYLPEYAGMNWAFKNYGSPLDKI